MTFLRIHPFLKAPYLACFAAALLTIAVSGCAAEGANDNPESADSGPAPDATSTTDAAPPPILCDLTIAPGDSFDSAFASMSAGQLLCLSDGTYRQSMDIPSDKHVRAVNDGMAEIDGGGTLGLDWMGGVLTMRGNNSSVRGLRVHHASPLADACTVAGNSNTMRMMSCSHGGSHKHKIPLKVSGEGHLIEDSWFYGEGRYVLQCFGGNNITLRRNVVRWDATIAGEPDEPNASMSNYSCSNMIWENNIALDYGVPATEMTHCGDMCMSTTRETPNADVQYLGNIVVNHAAATSNNRAFRADQKSTENSSGLVLRDFYVRSVGVGIAINPDYENVTIDRCTMTDVDSVGMASGSAIVCSEAADISVRYQDGTKTTEPLFPFSHEALIRRDMCSKTERQSDWCNTSLSLAEYILD